MQGISSAQAVTAQHAYICGRETGEAFHGGGVTTVVVVGVGVLSVCERERKRESW